MINYIEYVVCLQTPVWFFLSKLCLGLWHLYGTETQSSLDMSVFLWTLDTWARQWGYWRINKVLQTWGLHSPQGLCWVTSVLQQCVCTLGRRGRGESLARCMTEQASKGEKKMDLEFIVANEDRRCCAVDKDLGQTYYTQVKKNVVPSQISPCFVFQILVVYVYTCVTEKLI